MLNLNLEDESVLRAGAAAGCAFAAAAAGLAASLPLALPFSLGPASWVAPGLTYSVRYPMNLSMRRHLAEGCNILTVLHLRHRRHSHLRLPSQCPGAQVRCCLLSRPAPLTFALQVLAAEQAWWPVKHRRC